MQCIFANAFSFVIYVAALSLGWISCCFEVHLITTWKQTNKPIDCSVDRRSKTPRQYSEWLYPALMFINSLALTTNNFLSTPSARNTSKASPCSKSSSSLMGSETTNRYAWCWQLLLLSKIKVVSMLQSRKVQAIKKLTHHQWSNHLSPLHLVGRHSTPFSRPGWYRCLQQ